MRLRWTFLALAAALISAVVPSDADGARAAREMVLYVEPVGAPVVDPFRPPAHIGAPGNRGLEYGNGPGAVVGAAAAGFVTFAGPVGGVHAVTIEHADGLRTTYTGLSEVWVAANEQVAPRASLGVADGHLHFGALVRAHYLDPQVLLDSSVPQPRPRLIPPPD